MPQPVKEGEVGRGRRVKFLDSVICGSKTRIKIHGQHKLKYQFGTVFCILFDKGSVITYGEGLGGKILLQDKNFARTPLPGLKNGKWTSLLINNSF